MIPVQKVLVRYTVTTGVLEYSVPFALYGTGDVNVSWAAAGDTETQTRLAPGSDYSVTVFRDMTGGKVTLADGKVPAGATLAIESAVPLTQELDLSNTATVDTEATEGQLDRMVQMIQQLDDGLSRAVKANVTDSGTPEELLGSLYKARDAATAAAASEQAAEGSEQAAATSASQAAASVQAAAASAEGADQSRAEAAASAAAASQNATAARQSAEAAAESEDRAAQSAASILELQVEVATLDPGLPASGDYDPETGILHLGIPKGDSGASAIATPTSLGSVMPRPATRTASRWRRTANCASARPQPHSAAVCWPAPRRQPTPCPRPGKMAHWMKAGCPGPTIGTCSRPSSLSPSGARGWAAATDAGPSCLEKSRHAKNGFFATAAATARTAPCLTCRAAMSVVPAKPSPKARKAAAKMSLWIFPAVPGPRR